MRILSVTDKEFSVAQKFLIQAAIRKKKKKKKNRLRYFIAYALFFLKNRNMRFSSFTFWFYVLFCHFCNWHDFLLPFKPLNWVGNDRSTNKETRIFESAQIKLYWIINLLLHTYVVILNWIWCMFVGDQYQCCFLKAIQKQFKFWLKPGKL